jgi:hypothetical protein
LYDNHNGNVRGGRNQRYQDQGGARHRGDLEKAKVQGDNSNNPGRGANPDLRCRNMGGCYKRGGGRKSDMLMVIKERGTLDISYREIKAPGGWAWVDHLIASIVIEMDISRHPTPTLLSAITVKKMGTMPWHARPRKDST